MSGFARVVGLCFLLLADGLGKRAHKKRKHFLCLEFSQRIDWLLKANRLWH